ncbi:MAG: tetratricopeptide repeat protein [Calditrichaceae bacterium]|nr:tetratricopeptide repeat protein [Calditrichaceae bacterium]MBN2709106.1 tetratricopeptide repeat protein [Calditrichaceae bacterium]RQV92188.1 MAG: tetratricopeptide repeat protein [Calditrichota bacterium]
MKHKIIIIILIFLTVVIGQDKRKVGLIPFENLDGSSKYDWISYGLEYLLSNKLSVLSYIYVPEKAIFQEALKEAGFGSRALDERMIYHIGKNASVEVTISGKYEVSGNNVSLDILFSNALNGSVLLNTKYREPLSNLFKISIKIVDDLTNLAGNTISSTERRLVDFQITKSVDAFESFVKGYIETEKKGGKVEEIIGLFKKAIREDPNFWEAYYNLGITYYNSSRYDEALAQFNKVIQALPNFDKPYYGRGLIYEQQKKYREAIADFIKVTEFNPNDYKPYYYLGKINVQDKNYAEAEKYLKKALEINHEYALSYYEYGNIYYNQNDFRRSIEYYKKATELAKDNPDFHLKLGDTYYRSQIYYNAYNELKLAIGLRPDDPIAHFLMGITVYKRAVLEELVEAFLDMLSAEPEKEGVQERNFKKNTALDPIKSKAVYDEMAVAFGNALRCRPNFMEAAFNLALTYHEMGNTAMAEQYYKTTLQIKPDLVRAHLKMATLYTEIGRKQDAIESYRRVFYIEPGIIVNQPTLGAEHQYINIYDRFMNELQSKLQTNPDDPDTNLILAKVFQSQGQFGKAANLARKVLTHSPNNQEAKIILSKTENSRN